MKSLMGIGWWLTLALARVYFTSTVPIGVYLPGKARGSPPFGIETILLSTYILFSCILEAKPNLE
jgi:hypothetical protein